MTKSLVPIRKQTRFQEVPLLYHSANLSMCLSRLLPPLHFWTSSPFPPFFHLHCSNRPKARHCERCYLARAKGDLSRRGSGGKTSSWQTLSEKGFASWQQKEGSDSGSGSGSSGGGKERLKRGARKGAGKRDRNDVTFSVREARLWGKLSELKDLPAQDSLAVFPAELGEGNRAKSRGCCCLACFRTRGNNAEGMSPETGSWED